MQNITMKHTLIVTGLSGAGKSQAITILEDAGYFCVDNVPPKLVITFIELCRQADSEIANLALVTDIRGDIRGEMMSETFQKELAAFKEQQAGVELLFLEAETETLVSRYQTSRRKHPLTEQAGSLTRSITLEREKLSYLRQAADFIIDTTDLSPKQLKAEIHNILDRDENPMASLTFSSFGFKYGMPMGADFVFDVRFLPNPFYKKELRELTGNDQAVRDYVMGFAEAREMLEKVKELVTFVVPQYTAIGKDHIQIAFGCTGGQHRSVTFANLLAEYFKQLGYIVSIDHRDTERNLRAI